MYQVLKRVLCGVDSSAAQHPGGDGPPPASAARTRPSALGELCGAIGCSSISSGHGAGAPAAAAGDASQRLDPASPLPDASPQPQPAAEPSSVLASSRQDFSSALGSGPTCGTEFTAAPSGLSEGGKASAWHRPSFAQGHGAYVRCSSRSSRLTPSSPSASGQNVAALLGTNPAGGSAALPAGALLSPAPSSLLGSRESSSPALTLQFMRPCPAVPTLVVKRDAGAPSAWHAASGPTPASPSSAPPGPLMSTQGDSTPYAGGADTPLGGADGSGRPFSRNSRDRAPPSVAVVARTSSEVQALRVRARKSNTSSSSNDLMAVAGNDGEDDADTGSKALDSDAVPTTGDQPDGSAGESSGAETQPAAPLSAAVGRLVRAAMDGNCAFVSPNLPVSMKRTSPWSLKQYQLVRRLHRGYSSYVYKGHCLTSNQPVAIKVYNLGLMNDFFMHQAFREVDVHLRLRHRNIITLYAAFREDKYLVLVMEYARGGSLLRIARKLGWPMVETQAADVVLRPLLQALCYLHAQGIIHRDLKPENILFMEDWTLKLADFGVGIDTRDERAVTRTGTVGYMAPEVERCALKRTAACNKTTQAEYGAAADIYSLGMLTWRLLASDAPGNKASAKGSSREDNEPEQEEGQEGGQRPQQPQSVRAEGENEVAHQQRPDAGSAAAPAAPAAASGGAALPRPQADEGASTGTASHEASPGSRAAAPTSCSTAAQDFISSAMAADAGERPTAVQLLWHPFITYARAPPGFSHSTPGANTAASARLPGEGGSA